MSESNSASPLGNIVELPCGFFLGYEDGYIFSRKARIKEMTGKVITELGSSRVRKNPALFTTLLLEQCVVSIADRKLRTSQLDQLLVADQDFLVMKIRQLSKGDIVHGNINCEKCQEKLEADIDLNELSVTRLDDPNKDEASQGYRTFTYENKELDLKVKFRYPTVGDSLGVTSISNENPVAAHNKIMESCLVEYTSDNQTVSGPVKKGFMENLSIRKYEAIRDAFLQSQPGYDTVFGIECWSCGHSNQMETTAQDFLISPPKK